MTQIMMVVVGAIMILVGMAVSITVGYPTSLLGAILTVPGGFLVGSGVFQLMMMR